MSSSRIGHVAAVLLTGIVALEGCRAAAPKRPGVAEAELSRRREGLERLARRARTGPLVPPGDVLVVVREELLRGLLRSALPYERMIDRYRIRVTGADVTLDDGVALVRLDGRASLASADEANAYVDVTVAGSLDVVELDRESGVLRGRVRVLAVEARRVGVLGMRAPAERLVEDLGRERLDSFEPLAATLEIPVRVQQDVELPELGPAGGVRVAAATLHVDLAVRELTAIRGRLFVTLAAAVAAPEPDA